MALYKGNLKGLERRQTITKRRFIKFFTLSYKIEIFSDFNLVHDEIEMLRRERLLRDEI